MRNFIIIFFILLNVLSHAFSEQPVVKVKSGSVRGYVKNSEKGVKYYGFEGIPFAKPPVGSLRFKAPESVDEWEGVFEAEKEGKSCPQFSRQPSMGAVGDEDCLNINVYTPQLPQDDSEADLLPVIVAIHGGGFTMGTGGKSFMGAERVMDFPNVFVAFNYRLGVLGFLSTEDENAYGNAGMLDQVLALKWVQENIKSFGGDPKRVTISGISAGSASVIYHMLSPLSTGLFHKAIAQSGTAINHWALNRNPRQWAKDFAKHFDCPNTEDTKAVVDCLRAVSSNDLVTTARKIRFSTLFPNDLTPVIEPSGGPGFLTEDPLVLMKEGRIVNKVPLIIGQTQVEGYSIFLDFANEFKTRGKSHFDKEFKELLQLYTPVKPHMTAAIEAIAKNYYDRDNLDLDKDDIFTAVGTNIISDTAFGPGIALTIDLFSSAGVPTYPYVLNHPGDICIGLLYGQGCGKFCSHGDDLLLQFTLPMVPQLSKKDTIMGTILNRLWSAFASDKTLVLNDLEEWPLYQPSDPKYAEFTLFPKTRKGKLSNAVDFWYNTIPNLISNSRDKAEL